MKKVICTTENTDVWELAKVLNEEQIQALLSSLLLQGKIEDYDVVYPRN